MLPSILIVPELGCATVGSALNHSTATENGASAHILTHLQQNGRCRCIRQLPSEPCMVHPCLNRLSHPLMQG